MRASVALIVWGALWAGGSAFAAEQDVTSPDTFLKALQAAPRPPCANGLARRSGVCPSVSKETEGFTLFDVAPGATKAAVPRPHGTQIATIRRPTRLPPEAPPAESHTLSDLLITFKLGSAELTDHGKAQARSFAVALLSPAVASAKVEIAGHTDTIGTDERNLVLSQARAEAVKAYLVDQGVDGARLTAKGYGSKELALPSSPHAAANRRVEARRVD